MSVGPASGSDIYSGLPGLDALGLSAPTTTAPAPSSTQAASSTVAGFTVLGLAGNGKALPTTPVGSVTAATGVTGQNVYQQAYDGIIAASNSFLQSTITSGATPTIPVYYAPGSGAQQFSLLQNTLAAISTGLQNGQFQGTGFNALA